MRPRPAPPRPSPPPLLPGRAGGAADGRACDWQGWAGRVAWGALEPEHRRTGGGTEPAGARSCPARRLLGATETFPGSRDPATPPPRDPGPVQLGLRRLWDGSAQGPGLRIEVRARAPEPV